MKDKDEIVIEEEIEATGAGVLVLSKPIDVNGEKIKELKYNFDDMTARDKQQAGKLYKKSGNSINVQELDSNYHLYLFAAAVKKENESIDINDILRISAKDSAKAEELARNFFFL